jgi:hypothetical protein
VPSLGGREVGGHRSVGRGVRLQLLQRPLAAGSLITSTRPR